MNRCVQTVDASFKSLPYQLSTVRYRLSEVMMGNGGLEFDFRKGSLRNIQGRQQAENYSIPTRGGSDKK